MSSRRSTSPPCVSGLSSRVTRRGWLVGKWNERRSGDLDALGILFEAHYADAREELVSLTTGPDPLFVVGADTWAVGSIEEVWQYGHARLQPSDLSAFEVLVQTVLGAIDPKLDLPVAKRWAAAMYGKNAFAG